MAKKSMNKNTTTSAPATAAPPVKEVVVPVVEPVVEHVDASKVVNKTKEETNNEFANIIEELENMKKQITKLVVSIKTLQKNSAKKTRNANIKSGFIKPVSISKELGLFMGTKDNELVPRNVVNKAINQYIKEHNLQVPTDKQTFTLDDTLANLFHLKNGDVVHYFKMQTYLKSHYPKAVAVV